MSSGSAGPRAARLHRLGEPLVVEPVPLAEARADEVVVTMAFGGVNPVDRYIAAGRVAPDGPLPRTLGMEGVGHVDGRAVLLQGAGLAIKRDGVWAEQAVVPNAALTDVPDGVDLVEAAGVGVAGVTAWRTAELARVTEGDNVLVLGASGGVGSILVSVCRSAGAQVWGQTTNPEKAEFVRSRGAHEVVVAHAEELADAIKALEPTVVFDSLGDGFTAVAVEALQPFGRLVSLGVSAGPLVELNMQSVYRKFLIIYGYGGLVEPEGRLVSARRDILQALADGRLSVPVSDVLPLQEVNEAFRRLEAREVTGKLILDLRASGVA